MKCLFAASLMLLAAFAVRADTVVFHTGEELEGVILEKNEVTLKLEVEYGTVIVPMAKVRRIDLDTPEKVAERERKKAEAAEFAKQMEEEGKVLYKGKWVTEEAKKSAEDKLAAEKKKKKDAADAAKKKADEAAAKAKEEQQKRAAELALQQQQQDNSRGSRFSRNHNSRDDQYNQGLNGSNNGGYNNGNSYNNGSTYQGGRSGLSSMYGR